ncbi:MAG: DivIVA domain-containing protein [candidate division Zixibacteria bacterium]|nr:DivIVA domain-containing protein [candidate division Zixibacteria bacterium]
MDLTPNDIRNYEFSNQMRGYDKAEVDTFLEQVATALETMKQENLKLSMEIDSVKSQMRALKEFEDTIKNAAIDARRNADMTVANAKNEAQLILSKARSEAETVIASRTKQMGQLDGQIAKLELTKKSYLSKLRGMINSHLELLDDIASVNIKRELSSEAREDDIEVTDSAEVKSGRYETIATPPSKDRGIKAEEADAAEQILPTEAKDGKQPPEKAEAEATEEPEKDTSALDPELAAALQSYTRQKEAREADRGKKAPDLPPPPPLGHIVETEARAEDVPDGFITGEAESPAGAKDTDTDRVEVGNGMEHNAIDPDDGPDEEKPKGQFNPDDLADELDNIAARFAEEMDKAEKN